MLMTTASDPIGREASEELVSKCLYVGSVICIHAFCPSNAFCATPWSPKNPEQNHTGVWK